MKIIIRLEKDGKYVEKSLTKKMICALYDLQYMLDDVWGIIELNNKHNEIKKFFRIIDFVDQAMHGNIVYGFDDKTKKFVPKGKSYWAGKPKWKKI